MRATVHDAVSIGRPAATKNLIQNMVAEVRVTGHRTVRPVFRVPLQRHGETSAGQEEARAMSGRVHPAGFEPAAGRLEVCCSIH